MKPTKTRVALALLAFLLLMPTMPHLAFGATTPTGAPEWTRYPLIAHGLGGLDGVELTNSLEAFETNYDKGQRVFEVDLSLTADGLLAGRHDWMSYLDERFELDVPASEQDQAPTMAEFLGRKILKQYTPISFDDVARLLVEYPDAYIITDTKEEDPQLVARQFTLIRDTIERVDPTIVDRVIPEIYSPEMMETVKAIVPFPNVIFSIYLSSMTPDEVVQYVGSHGIRVVAMPVERATAPFMKALRRKGAVAYVHAVNEVADVNAYMAMGVHGVYTDFLSYADLGWAQPEPSAAAKERLAALAAKERERASMPSIIRLGATSAVQAAEQAGAFKLKAEEQAAASVPAKTGLWTSLKSFVRVLF
ncbi:phosphatidylinositol-specific phospholipase C/glycerophosphodiester phosphodiesterase family protein [Paenibacillus cymbidii]|uniref:phosphatidylinositol-specific phospholipase C/glycerophosphodiester phosphodiesterase family protein n=1 Tax=Paenibacillus cymbidii TaxID=1639034 RepID=UPI0014368709|nr:phosphatidylinositol-specific phospholipase C/glycerophosphodiester phosphodiesterase family protein [Paenibacillus cymbidii]